MNKNRKKYNFFTKLNKLQIRIVIFFYIIFLLLFISCTLTTSDSGESKSDPISAPIAVLSGTPENTTNNPEIDITVSGKDLATFKFKIDTGEWSQEININYKIDSTDSSIYTFDLGPGTHTLFVLGKNENNTWQAISDATVFQWTTVDTSEPIVQLTNAPSDPTQSDSLDVTVDGTDVATYKYKIDSGSWSNETNISIHITESSISTGRHTLYVIGKKADGTWQDSDTSTTHSWTVQTVVSLDNITNFTEIPGNGTANLSWTNPSSSFDSIAIRRKIGTEPTGPTDGTEVYNGTAQSYQDSGLTNGNTYYYTAYTRLGTTYSSGVTITVTPVEPSTGNYVQTDKDNLGGAADTTDNFGTAVAIDGNYAIIGAPGDKFGASWLVGAAYVYEKIGENNWVKRADLFAINRAENDYFGCSVAISGDYAVVGSKFNDDNGSNSGSVYVFKRTGTVWNILTKINPVDGAAGDNFGISVAIEGDYLVVGTEGDNAGSAYVYKRNADDSFSQQTKLIAADGTTGEMFGHSISINGEYVVVGAYNHDSHGAAYIFKRDGSTWSQQAKLISDDIANGDFFGWSVSISGEYAVVGVELDDDGGEDSGSAYIFKRSGTSWSQQAKLTASDTAENDCFGFSVSISGNIIMVGACYENSNRGAVYTYSRSGIVWTQKPKLIASDAATDDYFGCAVALDADKSIFGTYGDDDNAKSGSGSVYFFEQ